ncbi:MAG: ATP-binding cassette domain-containing protein [Lachnospira sp.]
MKKLELKNIKKTYNETIVLDGFSAICDSSKPSCIMGESGAGKTTLLNIIMGLVSADSGMAGYSFQLGAVMTDGGYRTSAVFQETSLVPHLNPVINVAMVLGNNSDKKRINQELGCLIDEEFLDKPCAQYSGGMKRRVEIVRAIMADSDIVVMDEPFAGLDDTTKNKVIGYIMDNIGDRILIISTHDLSDAEKLRANVFFVDT